MTTFTIHEFATVTATGEPVQPPYATTPAVAVDAPARLGAQTVYFDVVPTADMYFAVGGSAVTAGANDYKVLAGEARGAPVVKNSRPYVVGH